MDNSETFNCLNKHNIIAERGNGELRKSSLMKHLGIVMLPVFSLFLLYHVIPVNASDPSLTEILNNLGFTNLAQTNIETFPPGTYNITIYAEFAQYPSENELSYYKINTSSFTVIFSGPEGGSGYIPPITKIFGSDYQFGLSLNRTVSLPFTYFTESSRNLGGAKYAKVYWNLNCPSMFLIGFDERTYCNNTGDFDCNDMVFSLQLQYYLRVVSPYDTPSGEGWYFNGTNAFASLANGVIDYGNGTRAIFTHWSGDASGTNYSKSEPIYMNQNKTAIANWKTQHLLAVVTDPAGLSPQPTRNPIGEASPANGWWYDTFTGVTLTAQSISGYTFNYWDVDGISQGTEVNPITVNMNAPHTATAYYTPVPPPSVSITPLSASICVGQSVTFTSSVSGGTTPYSYQWYLNNVPISGATSNSWAFTPATSGIHYVYLKVTDANGNTAQSQTARITVAHPPVGGYSISLAKQTPLTPIAAYTTLIALFATELSLTKRKRK